MPIDNLTPWEMEKKAELVRMKRLATGLLIVMTVVFVASRYFQDQCEYGWLSFVEAAAEAAMIGALADWFAVTALFRHPLGIKIPHTAIIPARKQAIAGQFGRFVQQNFLSESVISGRIRSMNLSQRVAEWLVQPANARAIAEQLTAGFAGVVRAMNDADVQKLIEGKVADRIRDTSFAPMIGDLLSFITSGRRQQELINVAVRGALYLLEDSDRDLRSTVGRETPWWFPSSVDQAIYQRIVRSISKMLYDMQVDIYHPIRVRLVEMLNTFMNDLKHSADIRAREATLKEDILQQPAVKEFTVSLWKDIRQSLENQSADPDGALKQTIADSVLQFGQSLLAEPLLARKVEIWADDSARYLIRTYGDEVAELIRQTIDAWDPVQTSERIEIQIGKDLQFIRINGTLVGGLAGLTIHSIAVLADAFLR